MAPIKIQLSHLHEISTAILQRQRGRQLWLTSIIYDIWFLQNSSLAIVYYSIYVFMSPNLFILSDAACDRDFSFLCKLKEAVDNLISEQHAPSFLRMVLLSLEAWNSTRASSLNVSRVANVVNVITFLRPVNQTDFNSLAPVTGSMSVRHNFQIH